MIMNSNQANKIESSFSSFINLAVLRQHFHQILLRCKTGTEIMEALMNLMPTGNT